MKSLISQAKSPLDLLPSPSLKYVELLGRSYFSFLQGASSPVEMISQAQSYNYSGIALCDLNGLYGVAKAYEAIARPSHFLINSQPEVASNFNFYVGAELSLPQKKSIALLPMNKDGYTQLCQLITKAKRNSAKNYSQIKWADLSLNSSELIALPLPPWDTVDLEKMKNSFADRLYLPIWKDFTWESLAFYQQALQIEVALDIPLVATQRAFLHDPCRKQIHDVLTCILHHTSLAKAKTHLLTNSERHLKPLHKLKLLWKDRPDILARTYEVGQRLQFSLKELRYQYPKNPASTAFPSSQEHLKHLVAKGLKSRFPDTCPPNVHKTVEKELKLIFELKYEDYFLTLWSICEFARKKDILFQGRGSAANSVVCFALGLTSVNPTQIDLLFERFLSKERGEPPDIDIDFESQRREEVIQYIYQSYGSDHAAMISTVICYRSRMALREVAKTLDIPQETVNFLVKFMGREGVKHLIANPESITQKTGLDPQKFNLLMTLATQLIGFPRHLSIHTGGFLISQRPITECVPIESASMEHRYVVQWNKDDIETLGLMKIDILSLGMLSAIKKCFASLKQHLQLPLSLNQIPQEDTPTYHMIQKADTIGVFQIESRAQMSLLPRLRPKTFYDLVIQVAIVRPGPIKGGMVHPYLRRRKGEEKVIYAHPDLIPILKKTLGVPIFQEQIMRIATTACGFSPGEADELRRVMSAGWVQPELMSQLRQRIINGMLNHGIQIKWAQQIYNTIEGFASYGFPESHSASFAQLSYASSYLKCHYPAFFVVALLNSQPMGFYSPGSLIADAQRHEVIFLPLSLHNSEYDYSLEKNSKVTPAKNSYAVRLGLRAIKGLQKSFLKRLVLQRNGNGSFKNLEDFIQRVHPSKSNLLKLGAAGVFEDFGLDVRSTLWNIQALNLDSESLMFGQAKESFSLIPQKINNHESQWEKLKRNYHWQGYSIENHPMKLLRSSLNQRSEFYVKVGYPAYLSSKDISTPRSSGLIRLAGLLSLQQRPPSAKGFAFLSLEDESGLINIILTPQVYKQYRSVIALHPFLEILGHIEFNQGHPNIKATALRALDLAPPELEY